MVTDGVQQYDAKYVGHARTQMNEHLFLVAGKRGVDDPGEHLQCQQSDADIGVGQYLVTIYGERGSEELIHWHPVHGDDDQRPADHGCKCRQTKCRPQQ